MINNIECRKSIKGIEIVNIEENEKYTITVDTKEFSLQKFYSLIKYNRDKEYVYKPTKDLGKDELGLLFNKVNEVVDKMVEAINEKSKELKLRKQVDEFE